MKRVDEETDARPAAAVEAEGQAVQLDVVVVAALGVGHLDALDLPLLHDAAEAGVERRQLLVTHGPVQPRHEAGPTKRSEWYVE
ncbi:MAG: hypothetical protein R2695_21225 [Acidimicrobiales bacterium]